MSRTVRELLQMEYMKGAAYTDSQSAATETRIGTTQKTTTKGGEQASARNETVNFIGL
jgi:hypothetical protein